MALVDNTPSRNDVLFAASCHAAIEMPRAKNALLGAENAALVACLVELEHRLGLNRRHSAKPLSNDGRKS